jgi:hypothetical protein
MARKVGVTLRDIKERAEATKKAAADAKKAAAEAAKKKGGA